MAAYPLTNSRKRPRAFLDFSAQNFGLDVSYGVSSPSSNKRKGEGIIPQSEISSLLSSSSSEHPSSISSFFASPSAKEEIGSSFPRVTQNGCGSALSDTADSATIDTSLFLSALPREGQGLVQECHGCASSEQEAESRCDGNDASEVDIASFLLHEVWEEDAISDGGEAVTFNPETVFLIGGASTDSSEVLACSAENGNWFLNDLEGEGGHGFLNEVLDHEWMAAALENLDRINDTLNADSCVLHLLEADHTDKQYQLSE